MVDEKSVSASEPLDLIRLCLDEQIFVKLRGNREMTGKLHAYDSHCNIVLGDATETIYYLESGSEDVKSRKEKSELVFVRGDSVMSIADASNIGKTNA
ncbi:DEKNAAC104545 [Brettanomyces naardenensis]|uniref:LSM complex subunit LSM3 n=1 Tax=Brettanomyces naardenensis TaxID=13370 RepID=A0A448YR62_BRENA|nr:DEKNAAC104545 [Brettanomyces naardenensis]